MNYVLSRSYFSLVATFLRSFVRSPQAAWINYVSFFFKLNFPCLSFLSTRNENFLFVYLFILSGKRSESDLRIHVSHRRVNLPRGYVYLHREKKKLPTARNVLPWKILERFQPASLHDDLIVSIVQRGKVVPRCFRSACLGGESCRGKTRPSIPPSSTLFFWKYP